MGNFSAQRTLADQSGNDMFGYKLCNKTTQI